jgi:uncharacterized protein YwgA
MGKGIALLFKKRFPEMYEDYAHRCKMGAMHLGKPYLYKSATPPWIVNFPTKDHWRGVTNLTDIEAGLKYLLAIYKDWAITSIAVPPLGCGLGQLEWRIVGPTLYRYLKQMDIPVELYAPHGTPHEELTPSFLQRDFFKEEPAMPSSQFIKPAWVALVEILDRLEHQPYHPVVGRTFFQKIAYVATAEGLPTQLAFVKGSYGPFSSELKPMIARLLNNGLIQEEQKGKMFRIRPGSTYADARLAYASDLERWNNTIERTVDLFMRMDTQQAEVAATVLFAENEVRRQGEEAPSERKVFDYVMQWKLKRRPPLNAIEVALAVRNLAALGWLKVAASENLPVGEELADA